MDADTDGRRAHDALERRAAEQARRDALKDLRRGRAPEQVEEDYGVEGVESPDGQRPEQKGPSRAHERSVRRTEDFRGLFGIVCADEQLHTAQPQARRLTTGIVGLDQGIDVCSLERALGELGVNAVGESPYDNEVGMFHAADIRRLAGRDARVHDC